MATLAFGNSAHIDLSRTNPSLHPLLPFVIVIMVLFAEALTNLWRNRARLNMNAGRQVDAGVDKENHARYPDEVLFE